MEEAHCKPAGYQTRATSKKVLSAAKILTATSAGISTAASWRRAEWRRHVEQEAAAARLRLSRKRGDDARDSYRFLEVVIRFLNVITIRLIENLQL